VQPAPIARLSLLAKAFGPRGLPRRRLASLAPCIDLPLQLAPTVGRRQSDCPPRPSDDKGAWVDDTSGWHGTSAPDDYAPCWELIATALTSR